MFAGGGTGGHLFPAIAIADEVRAMEPGADILFVGTKGRIEARVVPARGYAFRTIWISGFRRGLRLSNLLFPAKVAVAMMQSLSLVRQFRPDVVVGTGGYVAGPVLRAAVLRGVPTLIQEQNSYPGVTTRMLASKVNEVHVAFGQSVQYFSRKDNLRVTGNPTRGGLESAGRDEALQYFGFSPADARKTILAFGGSLGAHSMNVALGELLGDLMGRKIRLIWQTGAEDYPEAARRRSAYPAGEIWTGAFIDRMDYAYAASDLVMCRAGATTIAELTRLGKPAVLVPYPHAAAHHQEENAKALEAEGAAVCVGDGALAVDLLPALLGALDEETLSKMRERSRALGRPGAARAVAERVIALARGAAPAAG
jgi:UDP-N-acetylglucosamine--N-acetylmuramyl-(pentapeptide) pyrophosphoryl-undecaprenol N-acetylglucosamine transferase